jgi:hypothetical protein
MSARLVFVRTLLVCAAGALCAPAARADKIDARLHDQAPAILAALKKADVNAVGVLRFRAERGKKTESFSVGPINDGMAARIENLLVIHADRTKPIGVLKDPSAAAAAAKLGAWYTNPPARRKLFEHEFPLAWGGTKSKPDAFLTGEVQCKGDMTKTTVVIEMFTAKEPTKLVKLVEFTVPTDRLILTDLGERFSVPRGTALRRSIDLDRFAIGEARRREGDQPDDKPDTKTDTGTKPTDPPPSGGLNVGGVTFQLLSGDESVAFRPSTSAEAKWEVTSPSQDKPVVMTLKNTTSKRVGVVLKVNETSTIFSQTEDSALCRKWVIEPGKEIKVQGFYQEDKTYAPFKVLVGDEAKQAIEQLGDKAGRIRVEVFDEAGSEDDVPLSISLPRRVPDAKFTAARRSLDALQTELMRQARVKVETKTEMVGGKVVKREIIVPDKEVRPGDFKAAIRRTDPDRQAVTHRPDRAREARSGSINPNTRRGRLCSSRATGWCWPSFWGSPRRVRPGPITSTPPSFARCGASTRSSPKTR